MALRDRFDSSFTDSVLTRAFAGISRNRQEIQLGNEETYGDAATGDHITSSDEEVFFDNKPKTKRKKTNTTTRVKSKRGATRVKKPKSNSTASQDDIVRISDSLTSLENAFNKIYAYSINVRNLQQYQEKRLLSIKRESGLESKAGGAASSSLPIESTSDSGTTAAKFDELADKIQDLSDKFKANGGSAVNGSNLLGAGAGIAAGFSKVGRKLLGPLGIVIDGYLRYQEGQSTGQIASGIGGGLLGSFAGGQLGGAVGSIFGPGGRAVGSVIGSIGGYFGGSMAGDKAYEAIQGRAGGGTVRAGGTYVVGERGPEVITFNGISGRVTPNGQRKSESTAEKQLITAVEQSARARAKLERERPPSDTSYPAKFSNYLSSLFTSIPQWMENVRKFFSPASQPTGETGTLGVGTYTPVGDLSGVEGAWTQDQEFLTALDAFARKWDIDTRDILGIMQSESGIDPQKVGNNGATGIFQFMPQFHNTAQLRQMSRAQQLQYADRVIFDSSGMPRGANIGQLYTAIYLPARGRAIGYGPGVLTRRGETNSSGRLLRYYEDNYQLDVNNDGAIDMHEMAIRGNRFRISAGLGPSPSFMSNTQGYNTTSLGLTTFNPVPTGTAGGPGLGLPRDGGARLHHGLDVFAEMGAPIYAIADGTVEWNRDTRQKLGLGISLSHANGITSKYGHLSRLAPLKHGDRVYGGRTIIGYVGDTGNARGGAPHLHLEVWQNGNLIEPYDLIRGSSVVTIVSPRDLRQRQPGDISPAVVPQSPAPQPIVVDPQRRMSINPAFARPQPQLLTRQPQGPISTPPPGMPNPLGGRDDMSRYFIGPLRR